MSEKHGVNPSLCVCFVCGEDNGKVIFVGRLPNDAEAPRRAVWDRHPCETCKGDMQRGIVLIEVVGGRGDMVRTGHRWVITEDGARATFSEEVFNQLRKSRFGAIEQDAAKAIGLFHKGADNAE